MPRRKRISPVPIFRSARLTPIMLFRWLVQTTLKGAPMGGTVGSTQHKRPDVKLNRKGRAAAGSKFGGY